MLGVITHHYAKIRCLHFSLDDRSRYAYQALIGKEVIG
jgi:hypothetical protein